MNEQDKILLSAYLDSDLDEAEALHVDELLQSSEEAKEYLETLKQVKVDNKNYFENSLQSKSYQESSDFLDQLQSKQTKRFSLYDFLYERKLLFSNLGTFSAAILVAIIATETLEPRNANMSLDLDSTVYEKVIYKTRGASDELNNNKELLRVTISEMLANKSAEGILIYGSESFAIFIDKKQNVNDGFSCYVGDILSLGFNQKFSFCQSKDEEVLIYIN